MCSVQVLCRVLCCADDERNAGAFMKGVRWQGARVLGSWWQSFADLPTDLLDVLLGLVTLEGAARVRLPLRSPALSCPALSPLPSLFIRTAHMHVQYNTVPVQY